MELENTFESFCLREGTQIGFKKMGAVGKMKSPNKIKEIRAVLSLVGSYRTFISKNFSTSIPTTVKRAEVLFTKKNEDALQELKGNILLAPVLG